MPAEPLHIDVAARVARGPRGEVRLTEREAALLGYLAARAGRAVAREELLTEVWGFAPTVESRERRPRWGRIPRSEAHLMMSSISW